MSIDTEFEETYEKVDGHADHRVWTPDGDAPTAEKQGIHGTNVAVDFDVCMADGSCLDGCPVSVFEWTEAPGDDGRKKVVPTNESKCIECMLCVEICPVDAVDVDSGRESRI
ncbi:4Fe-4S binding protein [Halobellus sp. GM3]|uniref:4Fe-4S binding protein n=1 Tax=Halobellus sp. GM3 TaxID=3458410 RepID=UPI00403DEAA6